MSAGRIRHVPLGELLDRLIDYRGKTPKKSASGVKLVTAKVIKDGRIADCNHEYIPETDYDAWMRRGLPKQWDIVITTEAPLGEVAMLRSTERVALAQRVILLRANGRVADQRYLFQALKSPLVQGRLRSRGTGTTVLGIKQSELVQVEIPIPPLDAQRRIASILSAYDDLIENNTRRIAILEEMARRIYEEWFVHFRFPGHERARMVDSELGPVPEGWTIEPLNNLVDDVREAVDPESLDPDSPYVGLEHLPRRSIALSEWGEAGAVQSTKLRFREGDILFGKIRPYFHKVAVAPIAGVASSDAIIIRPKQASCFALALSAVSSDAFIAHATQTSNGTKMPRANWNVLRNYPVVLPIDRLKSRFDEFVNNSVATIKNFVRQNRNLRITRDLLLPKLISGELDVSPLPEPEAVAA